MKIHKHVLESFNDYPDHHFYCSNSNGCWIDFWSDLAYDSQSEEMYHMGYRIGRKDAYNPIKLLERIRNYLWIGCRRWRLSDEGREQGAKGSITRI